MDTKLTNKAIIHGGLRKIATLAIVAAVLSLAAVACGGDADTVEDSQETSSNATPAAVPPGSSEAPPTVTAESIALIEPISEGQALFLSNGCNNCHGDKAQGTDAGPALGGHTASQVLRQVRAPVGRMSVFPPDKISNEEIAAIAEFIEGLDAGHGHARTGLSANELVMHHRMALLAAEDDELQEAIHHVNHLIDLTEGEHKVRMKEALTALESGEVHDGLHVLENMIAGIDVAGLDEESMQLTLALSSVRLEDADSASHHMGHYTALAMGDHLEKGQHIATLIQDSLFAEAVGELVALLGSDPNANDDHDEGATDDHDDGATDDHDDEGAAAGHDDEGAADGYDDEGATDDDHDGGATDDHDEGTADDHDEE